MGPGGVAAPETVKAEHGVLPMLQSCHTAIVDGYVIEGHVPVADIERLLAERTAVNGIPLVLEQETATRLRRPISREHFMWPFNKLREV